VKKERDGLVMRAVILMIAVFLIAITLLTLNDYRVEAFGVGIVCVGLVRYGYKYSEYTKDVPNVFLIIVVLISNLMVLLFIRFSSTENSVNSYLLYLPLFASTLLFFHKMNNRD